MKRTIIQYLSLACLCLLFSFGCSETMRVPFIKNTAWKLTEWPGHTIPKNADATLNFIANGGVGGKAFCNSYGGTETIQGDSIKFGAMFSTKMYCVDLSASETAYLNDLARITTMATKKNQLILYSNGTPVLIFTSQQPAL